MNFLISTNVCAAAKPANNCGIIKVIRSVTGCFFKETNIKVTAGLKLADMSWNKNTTIKKAKPTTIDTFLGILVAANIIATNARYVPINSTKLF